MEHSDDTIAVKWKYCKIIHFFKKVVSLVKSATPSKTLESSTDYATKLVKSSDDHLPNQNFTNSLA